MPAVSAQTALHMLDIVQRATFMSIQPVTRQQETGLHADPGRVNVLVSVLLQRDQTCSIDTPGTMPDIAASTHSIPLARRMPPGELLCLLDLVAAVPGQLVRCLCHVQDILRSLAAQWRITQQCHTGVTPGVTAVAGGATTALLQKSVQALRLLRRAHWLPVWHDVLADAAPLLPPAAISKLLIITANFLDSHPPDASVEPGMKSSSDERLLHGSQFYVPDVQSVLLANVDAVAPLFARFLELTHRETRNREK